MGLPEDKGFLGSDLNLLNITLGIILFILAVWILIIGKTIIVPFMVAVFLTFILEPIVALLTRLKIPHALAVLMTLLIVFVLLYLLGMLVYANVQLFVKQFPAYQGRMISWLKDVNHQIEILFGQPLNLRLWKQINWLDTLQRFSIAQGVLNSLGTFVTFLIKVIIVIIFIAYLLIGKRNLAYKIRVAFPDHRASRIILIVENVTTQVQKYLGAKTLASIVLGLVSIVVFYAFGLDFAIFWGFIIFLFNFIPNIGAIIASLLPVVFSLLQFGSLSLAFWLLLVISLLQMAMGNIVEPRLMGRSLNLSPLMVILSLIFWGYIWGIAGMILAIPILGTLTIVFENLEPLKFISVFFRGKVE